MRKLALVLLLQLVATVALADSFSVPVLFKRGSSVSFEKNVKLDLTGANVVGLPSATWGGINGSILAQSDLQLSLAAKQPLNDNLTSLSALTGTNTMYYRDTLGHWVPVSFGTNVTFTNGVLEFIGGGGAVDSVFGRSGVITAQSGDYTFAQIGSKPTTLAGYGITDGASKTGTPVDNQLAVWTGASAIEGTSDLTFDSSTKVFMVNPSGSSTGSPAKVGIGPIAAGNAARFLFGDDYNAFQSAYADRMQIYSYWGMEIYGGRQTNAPSFTTGLTGDSSLNVIGTVAANPVLVTTGAASQAADLQRWNSSTPTTLARVTNTGAFDTTVGYYVNGSAFNFSNLSGSATDAQIPNVLTLTKASNLTSNGFVTTSGGDGTLGTASSTGTGNVVLASGPTITSPRLVTSLLDTNGATLFGLTATASAVNSLTYANAATGSWPTFTATGSDSNIGINFAGKGNPLATVQVSGNSSTLSNRLNFVFNVTSTGDKSSQFQWQYQGTPLWSLVNDLAGGGVNDFAFYNNAGSTSRLYLGPSNQVTMPPTAHLGWSASTGTALTEDTYFERTGAAVIKAHDTLDVTTGYQKGGSEFPISSNGIPKRTGAYTWGVATAGTDYWGTADFVGSGASHAHGLVPDPGASAGTSKFLREDATWAVPAGGGNVSNVGTPTSGQIAEWTSATTIQGKAVTGSGNVVEATSPTIGTPTISGTMTFSSGNKITTAGTDMTLEQTGDTYGATSLKLENRGGLNGALFTQGNGAGINLIDFGFVTGAGYTNLLRMENRGTNIQSGNTQGEMQFMFDSTGSPSLSYEFGVASATFGGPLNFGTSNTYNPVNNVDVGLARDSAGVLRVTNASTGNGTLKAGTVNAVSGFQVNGSALSKGDVGLGNVTNDAQTKAAIVPNTAPTAGQILAGNAGNTAYAPVSLSGSGATMSLASTGVLTISGIANASLTNSAITIAGSSTSLGGSISRDTITGVSTNGLLRRSAANTLVASDFDEVTAGGGTFTYSQNANTSFNVVNTNTGTSANASIEMQVNGDNGFIFKYPATASILGNTKPSDLLIDPGTLGRIALYPTSPGGVASSTSLKNDQVVIPAYTRSITGTTSITTATGFNNFSVYKPTYTDSSAVTITNAATAWIEGAPVVGGSLSITNPYALWVGGGTVRFDGGLDVGTTGQAAAGTIDLSAGIVINSTAPSLGKFLTSKGNGYYENSSYTMPTTASPAGTVIADGSNVVVETPSETAVAVNTGGWKEYKVTGSDVTNTSATLANVTGLVTGTLSVSSVYEFEAVLYTTASADTNGSVYATNCTVTPTDILTTFIGPTSTLSGVETMATTGSDLNATKSGTYLKTASEHGQIHISGILATAGSGSPVFSIQHAAAATTHTSTVKIGSTLRIRKK